MPPARATVTNKRAALPYLERKRLRGSRPEHRCTEERYYWDEHKRCGSLAVKAEKKMMRAEINSACEGAGGEGEWGKYIFS